MSALWYGIDHACTYPTEIHVGSKVRSQFHWNHLGCVRRRDSLENAPKKCISKGRARPGHHQLTKVYRRESDQLEEHVY
jgi:hypothetical protein